MLNACVFRDQRHSVGSSEEVCLARITIGISASSREANAAQEKGQGEQPQTALGFSLRSKRSSSVIEAI